MITIPTHVQGRFLRSYSSQIVFDVHYVAPILLFYTFTKNINLNNITNLRVTSTQRELFSRSFSNELSMQATDNAYSIITTTLLILLLIYQSRSSKLVLERRIFLSIEN